MNFGICDLSAIPVRAQPSDKSEMVSQLLFGETCEILERNQQWLRILTHADDYEGWIDEKQIQLLSQKQWKEGAQQPSTTLLDLTASAKSESREVRLFIGNTLPNHSNGMFSINEEEFQVDANIVKQGDLSLSQRIPEFAIKFLNTPYFWGGRSFFGMDCSGLTHLVFKLAGIKLRRDAWQQSEQGILISFIDQSRAGDLAFFHSEEGKITHTGIILEGGKIIHASGKVRIDSIDHFGIFNEEQNRYTHQLRLIRRMIE